MSKKKDSTLTTTGSCVIKADRLMTYLDAIQASYAVFVDKNGPSLHLFQKMHHVCIFLKFTSSLHRFLAFHQG